MILKPWNDLPPNMQNEAVRPYYNSLQQKKLNLAMKLVFDKIMSMFLLIILSPVFLILAILIKLDSPGDIMFRQERVTQYGQRFRIHKFRTMCSDAEKKGTLVTTKGDDRVTNIGKVLRGYRLDELPQLIDILQGSMSFVGTRPEVVKYVEQYEPIMLATLLLPAGITSKTSIEYKDEEKLLMTASHADKCYMDEVLPAKMEWNLESIKNFSFIDDVKIMVRTVRVVL